MGGLRKEDGLYLGQHFLGGDGAQAGVVAKAAGLVAVLGTGAAVEGVLHRPVGVLTPAVEAAAGVGGTPKAHHRNAHAGGKMHVGRVHADHEVQLGYLFEFLVEANFSGQGGRVGVTGGPGVEGGRLFFAAKEVEAVATVGAEQLYQALGLLQGPYLALVLGKRGKADGRTPAVTLLGAPIGGGEGVYAVDLGQAAAVEHVVVAQPRGTPRLAAFAYGADGHPVQAEEPVEAYHAVDMVHVGHHVGVQRSERRIELAGGLPLLRGDKLDIFNSPKERFQARRGGQEEKHVGATGDPQPQHGFEYGHIAQGGEADDEYALAVVQDLDLL